MRGMSTDQTGFTRVWPAAILSLLCLALLAALAACGEEQPTPTSVAAAQEPAATPTLEPSPTPSATPTTELSPTLATTPGPANTQPSTPESTPIPKPAATDRPVPTSISTKRLSGDCGALCHIDTLYELFHSSDPTSLLQSHFDQGSVPVIQLPHPNDRLSPLVWVIDWMHDPGLVETLLEHGAAPNEQARSARFRVSQPPLFNATYVASVFASLDEGKAFLDSYREEMEQYDERGVPEWLKRMDAEEARANSAQIVRLLLDYGANANTVYDASGLTPLESYVGSHNIDVMRMLLERTALDDGRRTRIMREAIHGEADPAALRLLGEFGFSHDQGGTSWLHHLAEYSYEDVELYLALIDMGADPELEDDRGLTACDLLENPNEGFRQMREGILGRPVDTSEVYALLCE